MKNKGTDTRGPESHPDTDFVPHEPLCHSVPHPAPVRPDPALRPSRKGHAQ